MRQITETQNLNGEGNCVVEEGWKEKVVDHLPAGTQYVSVFCENSGSFEAHLTKWRGFFPERLFQGGIEMFTVGSRFDIAAKDTEVENSEEYISDVQAIFSSKQFANSSFIGKWGSELAENIPSGVDDVYVVELIDSNLADKFYLQWL